MNSFEKEKDHNRDKEYQSPKLNHMIEEKQIQTTILHTSYLNEAEPPLRSKHCNIKSFVQMAHSIPHTEATFSHTSFVNISGVYTLCENMWPNSCLFSFLVTQNYLFSKMGVHNKEELHKSFSRIYF